MNSIFLVMWCTSFSATQTNPSLHSLHDSIEMEKHENFSYEVLFGDKDAIAQKLEEAVNRR